MPGIDKAAFLKRIGSKAPDYGESIPGESDMDESEETTDEEGGIDCGKMLLEGVKANDSEIINNALMEAVRKYGG